MVAAFLYTVLFCLQQDEPCLFPVELIPYASNDAPAAASDRRVDENGNGDQGSGAGADLDGVRTKAAAGTPCGARRGSLLSEEREQEREQGCVDNDGTDYDTASEGSVGDDDYGLSHLVIRGSFDIGRDLSGKPLAAEERGASPSSASCVVADGDDADECGGGGNAGRSVPWGAAGAAAHPVPDDAAAGHWSNAADVRDWLKVRGGHYLSDKKKVTAAPPVMECVKVDLFSFQDKPHFNVAHVRPESWLNAQRRAASATAAAAAAAVRGGTRPESGESARARGEGRFNGRGIDGAGAGAGGGESTGRLSSSEGGGGFSGVDGGDDGDGRDSRRGDDGGARGTTASSSGTAKAGAGDGGSGEQQPWTFVFQFMNPGPPYVSITLYFRPTGSRLGMTLPQLLAAEAGTPFGRTLGRFLAADKAERDGKLKAIVALINAPWALRQVLPRRPVILGRKVNLTYHQSADYFEVDLELASSPFCERIYRSMKWCSKHSVEDIVLMIESQEEDEMPEMALGAARLMGVDEDACTPLPPLPTTGEARRGF